MSEIKKTQPTPKEGSAFVFEGFEPANTTPVPDVLFDDLLSILSGTQLKVLLYVIRRTLGFKKSSDGISLSQFTDGITTKDGRVLDKGCGIKKRSTVSKILRELIELGCLESEKGKTDMGDDAVTIYRVHFKGVVSIQPLPSPQTATTVVPKQPLPGSADSAPRGSADSATHKKQLTRNSNKQETVQQEGTESARNDSPATIGADAPTRPPEKTLSEEKQDLPSTAGKPASRKRGSAEVEPPLASAENGPDKSAKTRNRTPRPPKIDPGTLDLYRRVFDDCRKEALNDESEGYPHTKASDTCIEALLALNASRANFVTPKKLHSVFVRLWNMPRDERSGFHWREHMTIKAICNNYEEQALAMTAAAKEKQRQQTMSKEEAMRLAREQAMSGELVGGVYPRYVPPAGMSPHYITAEQRAALLGGK